MVLPQALTEHLKGEGRRMGWGVGRGGGRGEDFGKASCLKPKKGFRKNTEIARSREEEERLSVPPP